MSLLLAWLLFPTLLIIVGISCGLLVERAARVELSEAMLLPVGLAAVVVVAGLLTVADATAELATPAVVGVGAAGLVLARARRPPARGWLWAAVAALIAFAAYAAPIVFSGEPTFAGYIKLDDTATWFAQADHVMERGRSLVGLPPSTYEATLALSVGDGYPVGAMLPLGLGAAISGQDVAWVFQPYLAILAGALALALYELLGELVFRPWLRAIAAALAAQPALLFGFSLWGGAKELAAAAMLAALAALVPVAVRELAHTDRRPWGPLGCLALPAAALLTIFSLAGGAWACAVLLLAAPAAVATLGLRTAVANGVVLAGLILILGAPGFAGAGAWLGRAATELTRSAELGNLIRPLNPLQVLGIWLTGDFRVAPPDPAPTFVLLVVLGVAALAGTIVAIRRRAVGMALFIGGGILGATTLTVASSPWVDARVFAIASPVSLLAALAATCALWERGRRVEGAVVALAIGGGVLTSNAFAYHEVWLAPRDQLVELEKIGERLAGQGPTLMTAYEPYGVRHFLRHAEPEGASELRRRRIPLRDGSVLEKGAEADVDRLSLPDLLVYRSLVVRRSPLTSRPPSTYRRVWRGRHWEAWQRPEPPQRAIIQHFSLGRGDEPISPMPCSSARRLARVAGPAGRLAVAVGARPIVLPLDASGELEAGVIDVPARGAWRAWLGGSFRRRIELRANGRLVVAVRHRLGTGGAVWPFGAERLEPGRTKLTLDEVASHLRPGSGGVMYPHGPLIVGRERSDDAVEIRPSSAWRELCGQRLDWIEALAPLPSIEGSDPVPPTMNGPKSSPNRERDKAPGP